MIKSGENNGSLGNTIKIMKNNVTVDKTMYNNGKIRAK